MTQKERYDRIMERFETINPAPKTELHYKDAYQLLVAVILSAQCTDKRVNMITPALFEAYPSVESLASASVEEIYEYIKSVSYPNNKSKALKGAAEAIIERFAGEVPDNMEDLLTLPGVGRKTANVILSVIFKQPAMAVDTHVFRVAERLGLTRKSKTPLKTETKLVRNIDDEVIPKAHHWLILHGRYTCTARNPECHACPLKDLCKSYEEGRSPKHLKEIADAKKEIIAEKEKAKVLKAKEAEKAKAKALKERMAAKAKAKAQKEKEKAKAKAKVQKQREAAKAKAKALKAKKKA